LPAPIMPSRSLSAQPGSHISQLPGMAGMIIFA
jgi:hypothetical protein